MIYFVSVFTLLFAAFQVDSGEYSFQHPTLPKPSKDYVLMTIPKSGTHLVNKLLMMLSDKKSVHLVDTQEFGMDKVYFPPHSHARPETLLNLYPINQRPCFEAHFNYSDLVRAYLKEKDDYVKIIMVRDLRDVCVSTAFYMDEHLDNSIGPNPSFDEKLLYIIEGHGLLANSVYNVEREANEALAWMKEPSVIACRFENLCGKAGGGTRNAQENQIILIANALGVTLSTEELNAIVDNLWGNSPTFRQGKQGGWKKYFKHYHIKAFKKRLGALLIQLGYEKDNKW